jgi:hypothetical protein
LNLLLSSQTPQRLPATGGRTAGDRIGGERREARRYALELTLHWRLLYRRRLVGSGIGRTRDLSSGGMLLAIDRMFPEGSHLEISLAWPALLNGVSPLKLMATGTVLRSDGRLTAVRALRYEFRTAGGPGLGKAKGGWKIRTPNWEHGSPSRSTGAH